MGDVDETEWRSWRNRPRITEDDVPVVVASLPPSARWAISGNGNLTLESRYAKPRNVTVECVDGAWFDIRNLGVQEGRLPSAQEYELGTPVVVIGEETRRHFFPSVSAIGREIRIGRVPYTVIGIAEKQGSAFGISMDKFAIVPYKAPAHRLVNRFKVIDGITIQTPTQQDLVSTMEVVRQTMRIQHKLRPGAPDDFSLQTQDSALAFWRKIQGYLVLAGIALPAIGLLVGSIVIMNIMLVAVAERTHEIGIRKALGAKRSDILSQFLAESTTLARHRCVGRHRRRIRARRADRRRVAAAGRGRAVVGRRRRPRGRDGRHHLGRVPRHARRTPRPDRRAAAGVIMRFRDRVASLAEGVLIAIDALRANKVRAALTILGIAIGVFVVVLMSAVIHGINSSVAQEFEKAGPTTFFVNRFPIALEGCSDDEDSCKWRRNPPLRLSEAATLERLSTVQDVTIRSGTSAPAKFRDRMLAGAQVSAYTANWIAVTGGDIVQGRNFTPAEATNGARVAVINETMAAAAVQRRATR